MPTLTKEKLKEFVKKVEKTDKDDDEREALKGSRKPPKMGPCKRCGKDRALNRLMLCYGCWVKVMNEMHGWREGLPHPETCGCSLDCKIESQGGTN